MSKGSTQRPTNLDKFSSNWDTIFGKKESAVITIPAQHNTKNPPGQVVNPVGVVSPTRSVMTTAREIEAYQQGYADGKAAKPDNSKHGY